MLGLKTKLASRPKLQPRLETMTSALVLARSKMQRSSISELGDHRLFCSQGTSILVLHPRQFLAITIRLLSSWAPKRRQTTFGHYQARYYNPEYKLWWVTDSWQFQPNSRITLNWRIVLWLLIAAASISAFVLCSWVMLQSIVFSHNGLIIILW